MLRVLFLLALTTAAFAIDASYQPQRVLISNGNGFAVHAALLGGEPQPTTAYGMTMYPDLTSSTDREDKLYFNMFWKQNPPITPTEATRLHQLEAMNLVPSSKNFAELVSLQTKAQLFMKQPAEIDMQVCIILNGRSAWVSLQHYEVVADVANAQAPEPPYFPGLAINHVPVFVTANETNVAQVLPPSWMSRWQPVMLRGVFRDPYGNTGDITLKFRRNQSVLMALGTMTTSESKFSIMAFATYNRESACGLPALQPPPWLGSVTPAWDNWRAPYAIDYSTFSLNYANYGTVPLNMPLPDYGRAGDALPCPAAPPCPPCPTLAPAPTANAAPVTPTPTPTPSVATVTPTPTPSPNSDTQKGNNGLGNGIDPAPPGDPKQNDGAGTSPGDPGNKKK